MISGCIINAECKLMTMKTLGDHIMVVGKVISITHDKTKKPLVYHIGKYHKIGSAIEPFRQIVMVNDEIFDWFSSESHGRFILKCIGIIIKSHKKMFVIEHISDKNKYETIPYLIPNRGIKYYEAAIQYLKKSKINATLYSKPILKRLIIKNKKRFQRINFILFEGNLRSDSNMHWKNAKSDPILRSITD
jgi:hypothetical protein